MKQIAYFLLPEQKTEANEFLAKNPPENVSMNANSLVVNFDDGVKNDFYKANEIVNTITSQESDVTNARIYLKIAKYFLEKYVKELEELNNTIISKVDGKVKYDISKDRETKIAEYKRQITGLEGQVLSFESQIEQSQVKIAVWTEELSKLNI